MHPPKRLKFKTMKSVTAPTRKSETRTQEKTDRPWDVIVLDDPVNLMEYVARVLIKIFGYSREKADEMMMAVHQQGKAIVWSGGREKAEMYVQQLHGAQLHATLQKAS
ncbi:ATP-dependent Clp protease adapter ClpS [bacterium]|nr:ATP-dependent Clp protease adapter ClpS [bacterium]